ncbi:S41 family peptidase [Flavobacterium sp.]|uniref:S41 family peptidase n=1 Tax=Flavobacterium sp. TaxID=239 RepID=UPI0026365D74|nr:S41 family peptidase [Flavobacterium sp.]MDD2986627.1 S41 family peptidase [Flavobacterium sp.]
MKKSGCIFLYVFFIAFVFQACEDLDDNPVPAALKVNDFVWKGLNLYYLWQAEEENLADNRFATQADLNIFLEGYPSAEGLFEDLLVARSKDRFSVIFNDYRVLEGLLQGTTKNNGMDYGLRYKAGSTTEIYGWVRYVLPNSDAENKNIVRGMLFHAINGTPLNTDNYRSLLGLDSYTIHLANYEDGTIVPNGQFVELTKSNLTENPVYLSNIAEIGNKKIGYLLYNGFYPNFENQLNQVFGDFKAQGITHLVLDLRYNSGGSVDTATRLASMITGQFYNQVFSKQQWNEKAANYFNDTNPEVLLNRFTNVIGNGNAIESLTLSKIYILTSGSTASASELIINGLKPYMQVVQIGTTTVGKNVGSITLYDSPTFGKNNKSGAHRYAMQPIVLRITDKNGEGDYVNGIEPLVEQAENLANLGELGNETEPLFNTAIQYILENGRVGERFKENNQLNFKDRKSLAVFGSEMYLEKAPFVFQ